MNIETATPRLPTARAGTVAGIAGRTKPQSGRLAREDARRRLTFEGLADVDTGRLVDHAAVRAWTDSLGSDRDLPVPTHG